MCAAKVKPFQNTLWNTAAAPSFKPPKTREVPYSLAFKKYWDDATHPIQSKIFKRRRQCLVHKYLYYVLDVNVIPDSLYDVWEKQLRELVNSHPAEAAEVVYHNICPALVPGSSNSYDYPVRIVVEAEMLRSYKQEVTNESGTKGSTRNQQEV